MSKIVQVRIGDHTFFAAIERDDGTRVFRHVFAPPDGFDIEIDGRRHRFVKRAEFAAELEREGLQHVFQRLTS